MASRKRQEDKHLQILRELAGQPHNKKCFDCGQRGPTYVNMTIGAFVCTSCSGLLRGLNPPHRIKSISMATFASQEIEFLQNHGNDVCRQTWLALWNSELPPEPESRDEQKMRDFLIKKYERKMWYSSQPRAKATPAPLPEAKPLKNLVENAPPVVVYTTQATQSTISVASPPSSLSTRTHPAAPPAVSNPQPVQPAAPAKAPVDLLSEFGGDPFGSVAAPSNFNAFSQPMNQPMSNQFNDPFATSPAHSAAPTMNAFGQQPAQPASNQSFNAFPAPASQPQPQANAFADPFGPSVPQSAASSFNPFGVTSTASSGSSGSNFDFFGSSNTNPTPSAGHNAFGTASTQPNVAASNAVPQSSSDRYQALSQLDDIFRGSNTQSVFTSGPASSPGSGTGQPNPFMSPASGTSGAAMLQNQQQKPPNPFQTASSQSMGGGFGGPQGFGGMQPTPPQNTGGGMFPGRGAQMNAPVSAHMGAGQGNFMGNQGAFGATNQQTQNAFAAKQQGFGGNQGGGFGVQQGFAVSQPGFAPNTGGFGAGQSNFGGHSGGGFPHGQAGMSQATQQFGMQGGFGNAGGFMGSQGNMGGQMGTQMGGQMGTQMGGQMGGFPPNSNQMMGMNQGGAQAFGQMGGGFPQQGGMQQQPQQFGTWQAQPSQQPVGSFGGGGGFGAQGNLSGFNMSSQVGVQKATNPFM